MGQKDELSGFEYCVQALSRATLQGSKLIYGIHRGQIYYYSFTGKEVGCEIKGDAGTKDRRPCVIVSNNKANAFTGLVTVVPMTSKEKSSVPTRVPYTGRCVHGTFLCEQVITISNERLLNYCEEVDEATMKKIGAALRVQLAMSASDNALPPVQCQESELHVLKRERDFYKRSYFELIDRLMRRES